MHVDIGNALASVAAPGVPRDALERLDERVADAHARIEAGREDDEFGYAALNLPDTANPTVVRNAVEDLPDPEAVAVVGIGGSALGAATLAQALETDVPVHVFDNVDPAGIERALESLPLDETVVNVVSRSGTTAETLANFLRVREAMESEGVDWTERTLVTTGEEGPLCRLAEEHALPSLKVPEGVPGRFAALSSVGLAPAAMAGADIEGLLAGARGVDLEASLFDCPAYAFGATAYALDVRGAGTNAVMPYADGLERFAEWFAQLWAESLGKDGLGQTPVRALGATDQHSQLQLYRAGPADKMVTLVRPRERPVGELPDPRDEDLSLLSGTSLSALIDAEFEATEASLAASGRPNVRVEIDAVDARSVGALLYEMEAACILAGELYGVETFTQPAVEWGKRAARGLLGEGNAESESVAGKTELRIE